MSLKPEVVRVSGVHSVTNSSQEGDIGFPQLQLEKLFEAATVKELESGAEYTEGKKYAYLNPNWPETDPNKYLSIESEAHFYCVRDGYCGLDGSADHYYTKEGDDYKYNAVPPTGSWDAKLSFSDAIKDKKLYSISKEEERIHIDLDHYYIKDENGDYKEQRSASYYVYIKTGSINWSEENRYKCKIIESIDSEDNIVVEYKWQNSNDTVADPGRYISVLKLNGSNTFRVQLLDYIDFNDEGIWESNPNFSAVALYKLAEDDYGNDDDPIYLYMKNGDRLSRFDEGEITFTYDPADPNTDNSLYCIGDAPFMYPNYEYPYSAESIALLTDKNSGVWRSFDQADFPLFTGAALSGISKVPNASHKVYEKLAVTVNYKYSGNNNLKFIFTNKDVDGVLEACNLKSTLPSKYVHLTNLEYSKNS